MNCVECNFVQSDYLIVMSVRRSKSAIISDVSSGEDEVIRERRKSEEICSSSSSENDELDSFGSEDNIDELLGKLILEEETVPRMNCL